MGNMCQEKSVHLDRSRRKNKAVILSDMTPYSQELPFIPLFSSLNPTNTSPIPFPTDPHLSSPKHINYFRIISTIKHTDSQLLAQVIDTTEQKLYFMKIIHKKLVRSDQTEPNSLNNKYTLEVLDFPFITKLRYAFQSLNELYLFVDYVPGGNLSRILVINKKLSEDVTKFYAAQILLVLEHLHENNICECVLKTDSFYLDREGNIQLLNFGISKLFFYEMIENERDGDFVAPEISLVKIGPVADWFSFGVIIYNLLTGLLPFIKSNQEIQFPIFSEDVTSLLEGLINSNPSKRLGRNGCQEIKRHPFFKRINFDQILNLKVRSPYVLQEGMDERTELQSLKQSGISCSFYRNVYPKSQILVETPQHVIEINAEQQGDPLPPNANFLQYIV